VAVLLNWPKSLIGTAKDPSVANKYDASSITVLEGLEAVRKRPGMYVGSTDSVGFHHLLWEILDNSVDEAIAGFATSINVAVEDDYAEVWDNGRGIPFDLHPKTKTSALDVIFLTLHAGGKFGDGAYKTSGGLHGVGSSVVNALSTELCVSSRRDRKEAIRTFSRGIPVGELEIRAFHKDETGTTVGFRPDPQIFGEQVFDADVILERIKVRAYLTPGVMFSLYTGAESHEFQFQGGLADYLADITASMSLITEIPLVISSQTPRIQVALLWTEATTTEIKSFANAIPTRDGGTHEKGVDSAVVAALRDYLEDHKDVPKRVKITPADIREGLVALVSVFVEDPQFQGQTKDRLNNPDVTKQVDTVLRPAVRDWLQSNSRQATTLVKRIVQAAQARAAARAASEAVVRSGPVNRLRLPGKLSDCSSNDRDTSELFLVEGDSAGGSAKMARDRKTQAILALRGKIMNVESITVAKAMQNEEIRNIVDALGCGIGAGFDIRRLRYGKIILLMDADSDGDHIAVLALTFFFRFLPDLIMENRVFLAVPPLYRVDIGKSTSWVRDEKSLNKLLAQYPRSNPQVTRFKGLGEMPPQMLWQTTMDPKTRVLECVSIHERDVDVTEDTICGLMGKDVDVRYEMLMELIHEGQHVEVSV
jgi:DNA gyrase/topoisomerase IV subunit B